MHFSSCESLACIYTIDYWWYWLTRYKWLSSRKCMVLKDLPFPFLHLSFPGSANFVVGVKSYYCTYWCSIWRRMQIQQASGTQTSQCVSVGLWGCRWWGDSKYSGFPECHFLSQVLCWQRWSTALCSSWKVADRKHKAYQSPHTLPWKRSHYSGIKG